MSDFWARARERERERERESACVSDHRSVCVCASDSICKQGFCMILCLAKALF